MVLKYLMMVTLVASSQVPNDYLAANDRNMDHERPEQSTDYQLRRLDLPELVQNSITTTPQTSPQLQLPNSLTIDNSEGEENSSTAVTSSNSTATMRKNRKGKRSSNTTTTTIFLTNPYTSSNGTVYQAAPVVMSGILFAVALGGIAARKLRRNGVLNSFIENEKYDELVERDDIENDAGFLRDKNLGTEGEGFYGSFPLKGGERGGGFGEASWTRRAVPSHGDDDQEEQFYL